MGDEVQRRGNVGRGTLRRDERRGTALLRGNGRLAACNRCGRAEHDTEHRMTSARQDRKSTRLNSSHLVISYAVFCLKKKKIYKTNYIVIHCTETVT